jgi:hypothetical protein
LFLELVKNVFYLGSLPVPNFLSQNFPLRSRAWVHKGAPCHAAGEVAGSTV